jgi:hypothetical protein
MNKSIVDYGCRQNTTAVTARGYSQRLYINLPKRKEKSITLFDPASDVTDQ